MRRPDLESIRAAAARKEIDCQVPAAVVFPERAAGPHTVGQSDELVSIGVRLGPQGLYQRSCSHAGMPHLLGDALARLLESAVSAKGGRCRRLDYAGLDGPGGPVVVSPSSAIDWEHVISKISHRLTLRWHEHDWGDDCSVIAIDGRPVKVFHTDYLHLSVETCNLMLSAYLETVPPSSAETVPNRPTD